MIESLVDGYPLPGIERLPGLRLNKPRVTTRQTYQCPRQEVEGVFRSPREQYTEWPPFTDR